MRNKDLDRLKCILMFFVVLQHTLYFLNGWDYYASGLPQRNYIGEYLRCVQMPAFMLVSGFLFKKSLIKSSRVDILTNNILISSIVPLVSWGLLAYLIEKFGKYSWTSFLDFFWNKFWYFKVLLFFKVIFSIEYHVFKEKYIFSLFIFIVLILCPLYDNNFKQCNAMFPFFMVGYWLPESNYEDIIIKKTMKLKKLIPCIIFWSVCFIIGKHTSGVYDWHLSYDSLSVKEFFSGIYSIMLKISGTYLLYEVVKKIPNKINCTWGGYTIFVYPLHCIIVDLLSTENVFEYVNFYNAIYVTIRSIILAGILFIICNIFAEYIYRKKSVLAFLFMGKRSKK